MAGGNFIHRVLSYVVNEVVVNGLANSPAFQRFAVRTSRKMEDLSSMAVKKRQELAEQLKEASKNFENCRPTERKLASTSIQGGADELGNDFVHRIVNPKHNCMFVCLLRSDIEVTTSL
ncbi:hypothetical protein ACFE04_031122 [Oxalis oulophora]